MKSLTVTLLICASFSSSVFAENNGKKKRRPPREAISACESLDEGAACSFNDREGLSKSGTCVKKRSSRPAVCKPTR